METYTAMRHFADSWALLAMTLFFLGVVAFIFRPGARKAADRAASIPFEDDGPRTANDNNIPERKAGGKSNHAFPPAGPKGA